MIGQAGISPLFTELPLITEFSETQQPRGQEGGPGVKQSRPVPPRMIRGRLNRKRIEAVGPIYDPYVLFS